MFPPMIQPPPATQFQRNPLIEMILQSVIGRQSQAAPNPLQNMLAQVTNLGGNGGAGQAMGMLGQLSRTRNDQIESAMEAAYKQAQARRELKHGNLYGAQRQTEDALRDDSVKKLQAEIESVRAQTGQRNAIASATESLGAQREALTPGKVETERARSLLLMQRAELQRELTERAHLMTPIELELEKARIDQIDAMIRNLDVRSDQTETLTPYKARELESRIGENESQSFAARALGDTREAMREDLVGKIKAQRGSAEEDLTFKRETTPSRIEKSKSDARGSAARAGISEETLKRRKLEGATSYEDRVLDSIANQIKALQSQLEDDPGNEELEGKLEELYDLYDKTEGERVRQLQRATGRRPKNGTEVTVEPPTATDEISARAQELAKEPGETRSVQEIEKFLRAKLTNAKRP